MNHTVRDVARADPRIQTPPHCRAPHLAATQIRFYVVDSIPVSFPSSIAVDESSRLNHPAFACWSPRLRRVLFLASGGSQYHRAFMLGGFSQRQRIASAVEFSERFTTQRVADAFGIACVQNSDLKHMIFALIKQDILTNRGILIL